ncbi:hypothetical protein M422DRAFT_270068 [Sphaerobolus stellatus SS14]|uniref:Uncharacterized protein n=1 Tax=Sphaerobolus stellatus (strain SS14) TaxID=990650 RepID=A0A0C9UI98_SPHS4|nr:hypothetical protein M422DRAFT_270068 [Sphaerobolus stellatus SS14]
METKKKLYLLKLDITSTRSPASRARGYGTVLLLQISSIHDASKFSLTVNPAKNTPLPARFISYSPSPTTGQANPPSSFIAPSTFVLQFANFHYIVSLVERPLRRLGCGAVSVKVSNAVARDVERDMTHGTEDVSSTVTTCLPRFDSRDNVQRLRYVLIIILSIACPHRNAIPFCRSHSFDLSPHVTQPVIYHHKYPKIRPPPVDPTQATPRSTRVYSTIQRHKPGDVHNHREAERRRLAYAPSLPLITRTRHLPQADRTSHSNDTNTKSLSHSKAYEAQLPILRSPRNI